MDYSIRSHPKKKLQASISFLIKFSNSNDAIYERIRCLLKNFSAGSSCCGWTKKGGQYLIVLYESNPLISLIYLANEPKKILSRFPSGVCMHFAFLLLSSRRRTPGILLWSAHKQFLFSFQINTYTYMYNSLKF